MFFYAFCAMLDAKTAKSQATGEAASKIFEQRAKLAAMETVDPGAQRAVDDVCSSAGSEL
jgi:hypothetical protein